MGFENEVEQSFPRPCRQTYGGFKRKCELTSSIVPRGTSFHRSVELEFPPIGCDPAQFSGCYGLFPSPPELGDATAGRTGRRVRSPGEPRPREPQPLSLVLHSLLASTSGISCMRRVFGFAIDEDQIEPAAEAMRARPPLARLQAIPCPALGVGLGLQDVARPTIVGPDASAAAAAPLLPAA